MTKKQQITGQKIAENIRMDEYSYPLPEERIAKYPLKERNKSKLLIYRNGKISHDCFENLADYVNSGSLLVFNDTKVIQARLVFRKDTGARIEIFCLEPITPADYMFAFQTTGSVTWRCIVGNLSKWKGQTLSRTITSERSAYKLFAERIGEEEGEQIIKFSWNNKKISFGEILETTGLTPIPPYLNRDSEEIDKRRYQTIYSKWKGSVAAPTAGFHFTDQVLKELDRKKIIRAQVTLHIGTGTFKPVKSHTARGHKMHTERFFIRKPELLKLAENKQIIPVGTTSLRTIESLYWLGSKIKQNPEINPDNLKISQWESYNQDISFSRNEIVETLLEYMDKNGETKIETSTEIMIIPGYKFRMTDGLITNYHQPHSTLLLLIAAYVGEDWKKIYQYSLENRFRFLSYGDSSLLLPE